MILIYMDGFDGKRLTSRRLLKNCIYLYKKNLQKEEEELAEIHTEKLFQQLEFGKRGNPYIKKFIPFSVSHTGQFWAVVFDEKNCGLDLQIPQKTREKGIARKFYAEEDAEAVDTDPGIFFQLWTRREAFIKAFGGTVFQKTPSLLFENGSKSRIVSFGKSFWKIQDLRIPMPVYASVCTEISKQENQNVPDSVEVYAMKELLPFSS